MVTRALLLVAGLIGIGCNAVFGLDEGQLGTGGAAATGSTSTATGSSASSGGGAPATTSTGMSQGGGGAGGGTVDCIQTVGLTNEDFTQTSNDDFIDWAAFVNDGATITALNLPGMQSGLALTLSDTSSVTTHGGLYQQKGLFGDVWTQCVALHGDARRASGAGRLRVRAKFEGRILELEPTLGSSFTPFVAQCRLSAPIDGFIVELDVDQVSRGDGSTIELHEVHFDQICCEDEPPDCIVDPDG
jgi:hypothetical protein